MWTSTMDFDLKKVLLMQLVGRFYRDIYFSSYSPLQVQNLARQSLPESNWVRVRNRLSGICGNDLQHFYSTSDIRIAPAVVPNRKHLYPGHEVIGEVIEIGDTVQHLHVGDRVVLQYGPNCITAGVQPRCHACLKGCYNLCEHGSFLAPQMIGGGWSEEMLVHEQQLFRVPPSLSDEQAVMLEPTAIALHAALRYLPQPDEQVLIIGAGTIGLLTLQIVRALAPEAEISVMARYPFQVEQATRLGASHIIYPRDAYLGVQRATKARLYHGMLGNTMLFGGYNVIYDTIGRKKTLHDALRWTRAQGTIVLVGMDMHFKHIDLTPIWYQEINLLGSTSHGIERWPLDSDTSLPTFQAVVDLMEKKRIAPEQLITHHFAVNNYKHAILTATNKADSRAIKVVFDYSLLPASVVPNVRASAPRRRRSTMDIAQYIDDLEEDLEENPLHASLYADAPSSRSYASSVDESNDQPEKQPSRALPADEDPITRPRMETPQPTFSGLYTYSVPPSKGLEEESGPTERYDKTAIRAAIARSSASQKENSDSNSITRRTRTSDLEPQPDDKKQEKARKDFFSSYQNAKEPFAVDVEQDSIQELDDSALSEKMNTFSTKPEIIPVAEIDHSEVVELDDDFGDDETRLFESSTVMDTSVVEETEKTEPENVEVQETKPDPEEPVPAENTLSSRGSQSRQSTRKKKGNRR